MRRDARRDGDRARVRRTRSRGRPSRRAIQQRTHVPRPTHAHGDWSGSVRGAQHVSVRGDAGETAQDARGERVVGRRRRGIFRRPRRLGRRWSVPLVRAQNPRRRGFEPVPRARLYGPAARDDTFPAFETSDDPLVALHASLVEAQLRQARAAAAIARALDRVLILPPFLCGLDRVWFPHFGRFPGSQFQLPFVCPLDHVVAVENMDASLVREHSFLSHPEVPEDVRRSVAVVEVRAAGDGEADGANATWVDFPSDVRVCARGSGTGASAARGEKETCGWAGIAADASVKKTRENCRRRRRRRGRERSDRGTRGRAHERGVAPRYRRAVHERRMARERRAARMARGAGRRYRGDAWCCSKKGHRPYR